MSFPNIPDINPYINITLEDAVNLLLTSIALEEVSLSKLMDAETCKILCVLNDCKHKDCVLHDAIEINKSVDNTIQNMIKLQMLLQFKLEKVKDIIPTTSSCSTTTKKPCRCCLTGKGKGSVTNLCDEFNGQTAVLKAFVSCSDIKNRSIRYSVGKDDICLDFYASEYNIKIECPYHNPYKIILYGKGRVEKKSSCDDVITDMAKFKLTVCNIKVNQLEFKMEITAATKTELNHNSGIVQVKDHGSTLKLEVYC